MIAPALPIVWLVALGAMGVAVLARLAPWLDALERIAYGAVLGMVTASLVLLGGACIAGRLSMPLVGGTGLLAALLAIALSRRRSAAPVGPPSAFPEKPNLSTAGIVAGLVVTAFAVRWAFLWWSALTVDASGLWTSHVHLWGDWSLHLGDTMVFASGDDFPPLHPRFAGLPHTYHYLTSITCAALVRLGMDPIAALPFHSWVLSVLVALGVLAFARRLSGSTVAATVALVLFLVGGGLGWWATLAEVLRSHDPLGTLRNHPWDEKLQGHLGIQWMNVYYTYLLPQRATLYGFPLGMLVLTCLHRAVDRRAWWPFVLAGLVAGLLPFAHLGTLLALAMITPCLFVLFPTWRWAGFFLAWGLLAGPQFMAQQGGSTGALHWFRWQWGWVAGHRNLLLFWLENLGAFSVLIPLALATPGLFERRDRRFLWGFMPVFVAANVAVFQPWDWDNTKVLVWWFLAACILVATWMVKTWRDERGLAPRLVIVLLVPVLTLSGLLVDLDQALGHGRHLLLTTDELALAREVRAHTPPHSLFVVAIQNNHPVPVLGGRRVLMGYPGWLWSQGVPYGDRQAEVQRILGLAPDAPELMRRYGVDFVAVGPAEREVFQADTAAWRARYPRVIATRDYEVFDVRRPAGGVSASSAATSAPRSPSR